MMEGRSDSGNNVGIEQRGSVYIITLQRHRYRNAVNGEVARQLMRAIRTFEESESARVAVLYGGAMS